MGSLIATSAAPDGARRQAKRVLLACHIDEIGFYVRHVDDKGFVRIQNVGGFDTKQPARPPRADPGQRRRGPARPDEPRRPADPHRQGRGQEEDPGDHRFLRRPVPARPTRCRKKVRIGDPVTLVQEFDEIGQCVSGKCLDNRVAAFVAIEAMQKLRTEAPKYEVVLAATVQEEVGCRGAGPAAYTAEPDIAIAIDTTLARRHARRAGGRARHQAGRRRRADDHGLAHHQRPLADRRVRGRRARSARSPTSSASSPAAAPTPAPMQRAAAGSAR